MLKVQSNKKTTGLYLFLLWAMKTPKTVFSLKLFFSLIVEKTIIVEKSILKSRTRELRQIWIFCKPLPLQ